MALPEVDQMSNGYSKLRKMDLQYIIQMWVKKLSKHCEAADRISDSEASGSVHNIHSERKIFISLRRSDHTEPFATTSYSSDVPDLITELLV